MGVNSLPKTVTRTRQRRDSDLNPGPSAPEYSTLTTRLPRYLYSIYLTLISWLIDWLLMYVYARRSTCRHRDAGDATCSVVVVQSGWLDDSARLRHDYVHCRRAPCPWNPLRRHSTPRRRLKSVTLVSISGVSRNVRRILVREVNAPLLTEAKKILKIWLRNGAFWSISE